MGAVHDCAILTKRLYELVLQGDKNQDRDQIISNIEGLLAQRERLLPAITPPFTDKEKQLGRKIVEMNKVIDRGLKKIKTGIEADIAGTKKKKTSAQKYVNPYESLVTDGVYYDRKK